MDAVKKSAPAPLEGGHIEWIKQRLLVAGGGEGYQKIAREFLREHAGFACSEKNLKERIRKIWNDMHELTAGAEGEPPRWTAQEDECLLRLLPQRLGWAPCAAIINSECGSSRTAVAVRRHVAKMEKGRQGRKDFDDFMNEIMQTPASEINDCMLDDCMLDDCMLEIMNTPAGELDAFMNEIRQTPASELECELECEIESFADAAASNSGA
jgi:hypothetical protein